MSWDIKLIHLWGPTTMIIVGSATVNFFSNRYIADKSTNFGMGGLWGLTINSGRGATLKYVGPIIFHMNI